MADNLVQKRGESTWYCRLAVPVDVQKALGCKVLIRTLKTARRSEAMVRRLPILHEWKSQIAAARAGEPLPEGWQDTLADTLETGSRITRAAKLAAIGEPVPFPVPVADPADVARVMREHPAFVQVMQELVAKANETPMGAIRLQDELGALMAQAVAERYKSQYRPTPDQLDEIGAIADNPVARRARSPITPSRLKAFRDFRESRGGAAKHLDQQEGKLERLGAFLKQHSLDLDFDGVDQWLRSLNRAPKTLNQYVLAGSVFWKWAIRYDAQFREQFKGQPNPFVGHDLPQNGGKPKAETARQHYSREDLAKLYAGAIERGNQPMADLIGIGASTGARIEEICCLKLEHLIEQDGVLSFNIIASKTEAGVRVVPVHPALLITIERLKRDSEDGYLIPTGKPGPYGKRSHAISKAFGRLRTAIGFGSQYVFHSIRNTVITELIRADVPGTLIAELVGHETGTMTFDVYARGASAKQKLEAISKLPFNFYKEPSAL